jgi:hypothetical protein
MNYASDECLFRFTPDQVQREVVNWAVYRGKTLDSLAGHR